MASISSPSPFEGALRATSKKFAAPPEKTDSSASHVKLSSKLSKPETIQDVYVNAQGIMESAPKKGIGYSIGNLFCKMGTGHSLEEVRKLLKEHPINLSFKGILRAFALPLGFILSSVSRLVSFVAGALIPGLLFGALGVLLLMFGGPQLIKGMHEVGKGVGILCGGFIGLMSGGIMNFALQSHDSMSKINDGNKKIASVGSGVGIVGGSILNVTAVALAMAGA